MAQRKQPEQKAGKCGHTGRRQEEGQITWRDRCGRPGLCPPWMRSIEGDAKKDL